MTNGPWPSQRLRHVADVAFSSVDKKSVEGEVAVKLCNYTDVYYNDDITLGLPFMEATASIDQVRSFGLRAGDILITKDSETAEDIGVAAFVPQALDGVVCGYHLAVLRPHLNRVDPKYLFWCMTSAYAREQMSVLASGVTRYGLRFTDVGNLRLLVTELDRQRAVARFLDRETARIDGVVAGKQQLRALIAERTRSWTARVVCQGLRATTFHDSDITALGQVPAHWRLTALRHLPCDVQTGPFGSQLHADEYVSGGIPVVNPANLVDGWIVPDSSVTVTSVTAGRLQRHVLRVGDVVFGRRGQLGRAALASENEAGWVCGTGCLRVRFRTAAFHPPYLREFLRLPAIQQ